MMQYLQVWSTLLVCSPCLSSGKHHAVCTRDGCLDLTRRDANRQASQGKNREVMKAKKDGIGQAEGDKLEDDFEQEIKHTNADWDAEKASQLFRLRHGPAIGSSHHSTGYFSSTALDFKAYSSTKPHAQQQYWADHAAFTSSSGWVANTDVKRPYLQLDFGVLCHVGRLVTRGAAGAEKFTKQFTLSYSTNGKWLTP